MGGRGREVDVTNLFSNPLIFSLVSLVFAVFFLMVFDELFSVSGARVIGIGSVWFGGVVCYR